MIKKYPTEQQKSEVRNNINKWKNNLFLHQWDFEINYIENDKDAIKIEMQTEYKQAVIFINKLFWEFSKDKREHILVHELCHCIVQPLIEIACRAANGITLTQQEIDFHKESVTQHVANSIFYSI